MKDKLAALLAFLFAEDKKEHPIDPSREEGLLKKIQRILRGRTSENDKSEKGN